MEYRSVMVTKRVEDEEEDDVVVKEEEVKNTEQNEMETEKVPEASQDSTLQKKKNWAPCIYSLKEKETYHFLGLDITIYESLDHYGDIMWPGAVALCEYLVTHREQLNLMDKYVLELGAGTGLVSIVAALLGSWVTATDLPEILGNLRYNLMKNTRENCRYTPQVAELTWGHDLEDIFPKSIYRYHYIMASDVVYHHDYLDELLVTMKHFCQPGTKLIWANKVRFPSDLEFTENFKQAFHTTMVSEVGDIKIFVATAREEACEPLLPGGAQETEERESEVTDDVRSVWEDEKKVPREEEKNQDAEIRNEGKPKEEFNLELTTVKDGERDPKSLDGKEHKAVHQKEKCEEKQRFEEDQMKDGRVDVAEEKVSGGWNDRATKRKANKEEEPPPEKQEVWKILEDEEVHQVPPWAQFPILKFGKDVYTYVGQEIGIYEAKDDLYGAIMWPAALALCHYLETNSEQFNMKDRTVLELGAGTGLVSIVVSLMGAKVTATDLTEIMPNLTTNLMRNTSGRCRHTPQTARLFWGHDLEGVFPKSVYRYDYVLAADVVYHHTFLKELLATMRYFCQSGTKLIWANKVRLPTDLEFFEDFKSAFHTTLLADLGGVKLFLATSRESDDRV